MATRESSTLVRWTRRIGLGTSLVILVLAGIGAAYQQVTARADVRQYPPPGRQVDVGDFTMHLHCTGRGSPTVVLEAGATGFAQTWGWIQPKLATSTRVCSYDRAGMGWSGGAGTQHDGMAIARNLHALMAAAGETGPYVLVGHSLGGSLVRIYAEHYPGEVVALGLIDPSHEDQLDRFPSGFAKDFSRFRQMLKTASGLAHVGVLRATNLIGKNAEGLPEQDYGTARMFASSPRHLRTSYDELATWDATMDATRANRSLGDRPLVVVSAPEPMAGMTPEMIEVTQVMHAELATLSSRGQHHVLPGMTHYSVLMQREHAEKVAGILLALIDDARTTGSAKTPAGSGAAAVGMPADPSGRSVAGQEAAE